MSFRLKNLPRRPGAGSAGFSLIEMLIAAGGLGLVSFGVMTLGNMGIKSNTNNTAIYQADAFRKMIIANVNNQQAWQNIVADTANTSLACIRNTADCRGAGGPFRVRDAANRIVYDPLTPTNGFTFNGSLCTGYSANAATGSDACSFRAEFSWAPVCPPSGACINPQVFVTGDTYFHPAPGNQFRNFALNSKKYGVNFTRNALETAQGNGDGNYLAKWFSEKTLGSSSVWENTSGGFLGVGTFNPMAKLDLSGPAGGTIRINDGQQADGKVLMSDGNGVGTWRILNYVPEAGHALNADRAAHADHATNADHTNEAGVAGAIRSLNTGNIIQIRYLGTDANFAFLIDGAQVGTVKNFTIPHPLDSNRYLVHGSLEGPEGGVYYRGEARLEHGRARVELPSYFEALTRPEGRTVQLTLVDGFTPIAVKTANGRLVHDGYFEVIAKDKESDQRFSWEVKAVRGDVAPLEVEPLRSETNVYGMGPYTYTRPKRLDARR